MKQMNLWTSEDEMEIPAGAQWHLFIDGASKNNPGPSGAGFVLFKNNDIVCQQGFFLGKKTNNQAEYLALLVGIFFSKKYVQSNDSIKISSDSQLLVKQILGAYKVKDSQLRQLKDVAVHWLQSFSYTIEHVLRDKNTKADAMANQGVAKKTSLPKEFIDSLHAHEIIL